MKNELMKVNKHWHQWSEDQPNHVFCKSEILVDACWDIYNEDQPDYGLLKSYIKRYWDYCDTAVTQ